MIMSHLPALFSVTGGSFGTGRYVGIGNYSADILEYRDGDGWRKIGTMKDGRSSHGTSVIEFKDFERYCN